MGDIGYIIGYGIATALMVISLIGFGIYMYFDNRRRK